MGIRGVRHSVIRLRTARNERTFLIHVKKEKPDLFASYLADVFSPHEQGTDPDIEQYLDKPVHPPNPPPAFTTHQPTQVIRKLKTRKAPGADLVTTQVLNELPQEGLTYLRHIYNAITRTSYWPQAFKHAQIIMLPKPGKVPKDISSYRPISLLPTISKVLEKLLITHITNDADLQPWISHHQFGFRKAHSTI